MKLSIITSLLVVVLALTLVSCASNDAYESTQVPTDSTVDETSDASEDIIVQETEEQLITDDFIELGEMI